MFPFSAGTTPAAAALPAGACDCHLHVYDSRCPAVPGAVLLPPDASIADYRRIQARIRTSRAELVTPSTYGTDNSVMLAGLAQLGPESGRGIAVIGPDTHDAQLQDLHAAGVRGVRINLSLGTVPSAADIRPIAERIAPLGWHLQLLMPTAQLVALAPLLRTLPVQLVFDHFGRVPPGATRDSNDTAAHALLQELLADGKAWLKLSGGYIVSPQHSVDDPALDALARSFIAVAPERLVWGSDWPHATASAGRHPMPDDARQVDRLAAWAGDAPTLRRILVSNPERLYGFAPIAP